MECNMGITIFVNEVMIWKASGVPMEYFSVNQTTNREDNDAEDMIPVVNEVDNHEDRKTNGDDDSI